jgi:hypothetical protein
MDMKLQPASQGEIDMGRMDNPTASSGDRAFSINQLTKIGGISRKTAEAFYEIGIHTYAELAEYLRQHTAEEVSQALREHGLNRPPGLINIQKLTLQAEKFSQAEKNTPASPAEERQPTRNLEETPPNRAPRDHDAVFTVLFDVIKDKDGEQVLQTTVYDEKDSGREQAFLGNDTSQWVNWMLERANWSGLTAGLEQARAETIVPVETEAALPGIPEEPYHARLTISSLKLNPIKASTSVSGKKLKAELSFQLSGADAPMLASHAVPYRVSIYTIEHGKGTPAQAASLDGQLEPRQFEYAQWLEFAEPEAGRYDFHCVVRLPPSGKLIGYYQVPAVTIGT